MANNHKTDITVPNGAFKELSDSFTDLKTRLDAARDAFTRMSQTQAGRAAIAAVEASEDGRLIAKAREIRDYLDGWFGGQL